MRKLLLRGDPKVARGVSMNSPCLLISGTQVLASVVGDTPGRWFGLGDGSVVVRQHGVYWSLDYSLTDLTMTPLMSMIGVTRSGTNVVSVGNSGVYQCPLHRIDNTRAYYAIMCNRVISVGPLARLGPT